MQQPVGFELRPYATPFGLSDETLCYFEGTLIGMAVEQLGTSGVLVDLLPKLDISRPYAWPTPEQFLSALEGLLRRTDSWSLRSERDTDQMSVPVVRSTEALRRELCLLVLYCSGAAVICPTFQAHGQELDVEPFAEGDGVGSH
ncbi:hypothetical protein [Ideonella paludis]|uniref:hypothetical protein n=1 Tax=Ideonella paludis TaxID=1233411 RepID=UPI003625E10C